ncbi:hypothetical protein SYYSPA8_26575 [Streptomyces yaizuensis]|uniref:Uncharacterized protein n=1 Tax=Streptomyces yaizuensis TaxID=2989713 RepID=A0ABQ5P5T4_9ACTN|nr:hypothetical protein SYYSPA8_26575 [Streptomyces sp. YSPA8]
MAARGSPAAVPAGTAPRRGPAVSVRPYTGPE